MDLVGDFGDQAAQEVSGGPARHLFVQFDEGELRRPIDGDDEIELALSGSNLGEVDRETADRIGLEFALGEASPSTWGSREIPMALHTPMQRRARQMRDCGLQGIKAVVERQQTMPSEGDNDGLFLC